MEIRNLGSSGLKISAISYGNWLTHGSQVEEDAALACVRQALDEGITTFDTADVYADTRAESVLGKALAGERRDGLEIFTKVFWPTSPGKHNDHGLSRKHIMTAIDGSLRRLGTDYVDLYQAHRYDYETPLEETMEAFADVVHSGKALYIGVSEWRAEDIRRAHALARELHIQLVSNQPQYNMLWRVIEAEVVPTCEELGIGQIVWSPIAQGALTGKYKPGEQPPEGSRATDDKGGADMISRWMRDDVLERVQKLQPIADEAGLSLAQLAVAWVLQNPNVSSAIVGASRPEQVTENVKAAGVVLEDDLMKRIDEVLGRRRLPRPVVQRLTVDARLLTPQHHALPRSRAPAPRSPPATSLRGRRRRAGRRRPRPARTSAPRSATPWSTGRPRGACRASRARTPRGRTPGRPARRRRRRRRPACRCPGPRWPSRRTRGRRAVRGAGRPGGGRRWRPAPRAATPIHSATTKPVVVWTSPGSPAPSESSTSPSVTTPTATQPVRCSASSTR